MDRLTFRRARRTRWEDDPPPAGIPPGRLLLSVLARASGGMADAHGSGPCVRKDVGVQLPPCPPGPGGFPRTSRRPRPPPAPRRHAPTPSSPQPPQTRTYPRPVTPARGRLRLPDGPGPVQPCHTDWPPATAPPPASPRSRRPTPASTRSSRSGPAHRQRRRHARHTSGACRRRRRRAAGTGRAPRGSHPSTGPRRWHAARTDRADRRAEPGQPRQGTVRARLGSADRQLLTGALSTAAEVSVEPQPADVEGREDGDGVGERPAGHAEAVMSTSRGSKSG